MIEINDKWAIGAESENIILYSKSKPKGKHKGGNWNVDGYYGTLHNALTGLANREVEDTHLESLKVVVKRLDEVYTLIKGLPNITIEDLRNNKQENKK